MYEFSPITERRTTARSLTWVLAPIVVKAPTTAPAPMVQLSPMKAGDSMVTEGSIDVLLPSQTPGRSSKPDTSTSTLPSRMSSWAFR